jgi:hypothetical protein
MADQPDATAALAEPGAEPEPAPEPATVAAASANDAPAESSGAAAGEGGPDGQPAPDAAVAAAGQDSAVAQIKASVREILDELAAADNLGVRAGERARGRGRG